MASPAPAKSQPLHNFSLPHHLTWKKNHTSAAVDQHHHTHHRSRTRLSTPPPPPPPPPPAVPSSSSNPRRPSPHFDLPQRQSSPSSAFGAHVSRGHSPLLDSLPRQSPLRESESESDFRRKRSPASSSRRQKSPSYSSRRQSPLLDSTISKQSPMRESESESDFSSAAATTAHKSPVPEYSRSDLPLFPSDESKSTHIDPEVSLSNEKRKRSKISIRFGKNKLDETIPDDDQDKSTAVAASTDAAAEDEESVPKTWNLRPRRPINKQSIVNGNVGVHKHGGSLSKELRSAMNKALVGINPEEKKEKKMEFSISLSLSRSEIEEDLYALTGSKPSRRPKKRTKTVQRQIETLLPGLWLGTINADSYKVSEAPSKV